MRGAWAVRQSVAACMRMIESRRHRFLGSRTTLSVIATPDDSNRHQYESSKAPFSSLNARRRRRYSASQGPSPTPAVSSRCRSEWACTSSANETERSRSSGVEIADADAPFPSTGASRVGVFAAPAI